MRQKTSNGGDTFSSQRKSIWMLIIGILGVGLLFTPIILADGYQPLLPANTVGCYDIATFGVGMHNDGTGSMTVNAPGPVHQAFIEWVGSEDDTPAGDGTSTLIINGVNVVGNLAAGDAGVTDSMIPVVGKWYAWYADLGPNGYGLITGPGSLTLNISGWDSTSPATNGATVSIIYDTGNCQNPNEIQMMTGVDWYWSGNAPTTDLVVYDFAPLEQDQTVSLYLSHAGTDSTQQTCRGTAVWMAAGSGTAPDPVNTELVAIDSGTKRGYGINGGVEIVNDPFTSASMPCTPTVNPTPDQPYEPGHICPNGGNSCPYYAVSIEPVDGGYIEPEWGVLKVDVRLPKGTEWVAFQFESEGDSNNAHGGESGAWAGAGALIVRRNPTPTPTPTNTPTSTPTNTPTSTPTNTPTATPTNTPTPTHTPTPGSPDVSVDKELVLTGAAADGIIVVGQEATFNILVTNVGATDLAVVPLTDTYDPQYLEFLSANPAPDVVTPGAISWNDLSGAGTLAPGESVSVEVTFRALASTDALPNKQTINVAVVDGATDVYDQVVPPRQDSAPIRITNPLISITKTVTDPETGVVFVGHEVTFTIAIKNEGDTRIDIIPVQDLYEAEVLEFVRTSISMPQVTVNGNAGELFWADVTTDLGDLSPGQVATFTTTFRLLKPVHTTNVVQLVPEVIDENGDIVNLARGESSIDIIPTAVDLLSFTAQRIPGGVDVRWVTGAEVDTWGFNLWRWNSDDRSSAVRITAEMILATGRNGSGAAYSYFDETNVDGPVFYWLEEVEVDGHTIDYGPISLSASDDPSETGTNDHSRFIYLPAVMR